MTRVLLCLLAIGACSFDVPGPRDYSEPAVGASGAAGVQACKEQLNLPCGWVRWFDASQVELCFPWEDRAEIPHLLEMFESLYGDSVLSTDDRFGGVPLCWYRCVPGAGCNALQGCACLDEAP